MNQKKKKVTYGFSSSGTIGFIFLVMGGAFAVIGVVFLLFIPSNEQSNSFIFFPIVTIFLSLGVTFLIIAIVALLRNAKKKKTAKRLQTEGFQAFAEALSTDLVHNVRINGRNPYQLTCCLTLPQGAFVLKSSYLRTDPIPYLNNNKVIVYYNPDNPSEYFLDMEASLKDVAFF